MKPFNTPFLKSLSKIALVLLIPLFFYQAKKETKAKILKKNGKEIVVCPVKEVSDTIVISLSSLIESCQLIKLETKEQALFDNAFSTEISDNYICIKSNGQKPAMLFDKSGKFLTNLGSIGRGPGEYFAVYGMQLDEKRNQIYLFPFGTTRYILVYDLKGNRLKNIPLVYTQRKFKAYISNNDIVTVLSLPFKGDSAICFQQTTAGKLIKKLSPASYMFSKNFDGEILVNHPTDNFDFYNTSIDTLYHYNPVKNSVEPKFTLDFGSEKKPLAVCKELPFYYYASIRSKSGKWETLMVNKRTLVAAYSHIVNDFYGGIETTPVVSNGLFINNISAITLKNQIKRALKENKMTDPMREKLIRLDQELKIDDNNVILWGKLKQ